MDNLHFEQKPNVYYAINYSWAHGSATQFELIIDVSSM